MGFLFRPLPLHGRKATFATNSVDDLDDLLDVNLRGKTWHDQHFRAQGLRLGGNMIQGGIGEEPSGTGEEPSGIGESTCGVGKHKGNLLHPLLLLPRQRGSPAQFFLFPGFVGSFSANKMGNEVGSFLILASRLLFRTFVGMFKNTKKTFAGVRPCPDPRAR